jgi:hypothetical protein
MLWHAEQVPQGSGETPRSQFKAIANNRAIVVFPGPTLPAEKVSVGDSLGGYCVLDCPYDMLLTDDIGEFSGAILAIKRFVSHPPNPSNLRDCSSTAKMIAAPKRNGKGEVVQV